MTTWMGRLLLLILPGIAVMQATDGSGEPPAPEFAGERSAMTVAEVYQRAEQTLLSAGKLYHATIQVNADTGFAAYAGITQQWVDASGGRAREETSRGRFGEATTLITEEARYLRGREGRTVAVSGRMGVCYGAVAAASTALGCPGPTEQSETEVWQGQYAGRPAFILVTTGISRGSDETFTFTKLLYLDAATALPLALESAGEVDASEKRPTRERRSYRHEFIASTAVSADFFLPASIGYAPPDPEAVFNPPSSHAAVFWLGRHFTGSGGLPGLVLAKADATEPGRGPGYVYRLHYARADDPFGPPVVTLELWPRSRWATFVAGAGGKGGQLWNGPCWVSEKIALPVGQATVFAGFTSEAGQTPQRPMPDAAGCPDRPRDTFLAHVSIEQTVVMVTAPAAYGMGGAVPNPYAAGAGIESVVRALRPR